MEVREGLRATVEVQVAPRLSITFWSPLTKHKKTARALRAEQHRIILEERSTKTPTHLETQENLFALCSPILSDLVHSVRMDGVEQPATPEVIAELQESGWFDGPQGVNLVHEVCFRSWDPTSEEDAGGPSGHSDARGSGENNG